MNLYKFSYEIIPAHQVVIEEFYGKITGEGLIPFVQHLWTHPLYKSDINGILDLRNAELAMTSNEVKQYMNFENKNPKVAKGSAVLVAENPQSSAISMLYQFYSEAESIMVVGSLKEAFIEFRIPHADFIKNNRLNFSPEAVVFED